MIFAWYLSVGVKDKETPQCYMRTCFNRGKTIATAKQWMLTTCMHPNWYSRFCNTKCIKKIINLLYFGTYFNGTVSDKVKREKCFVVHSTVFHSNVAKTFTVLASSVFIVLKKAIAQKVKLSCFIENL